MSSRQTYVAAFIGLLAAAGGAHAAARGNTFQSLDRNHDFYLSRDEAEANALVAENFDAVDLDGDGRLAPVEFNNLVLILTDR